MYIYIYIYIYICVCVCVHLGTFQMDVIIPIPLEWGLWSELHNVCHYVVIWMSLIFIIVSITVVNEHTFYVFKVFCYIINKN